MNNRVVNFCGGRDLAVAGAAGDQHPTVVGQDDTDVTAACGQHPGRYLAKAIRKWIVVFRCIEVLPACVLAACYEHGPVDQQRSACLCTLHVQRSRGQDVPLPRIKEVSGIQNPVVIGAARDQDPSILKKGRGVILARANQVARHKRKLAADGIVDFEAGQGRRAVVSTGHQHSTIINERCVCPLRAVLIDAETVKVAVL
jgi:hypothetical protein